MIKQFNIVRNAEKTPDSNYDVALMFDFDTVETLDEYQKSQQHMEFGEFVYSIRVIIKNNSKHLMCFLKTL